MSWREKENIGRYNFVSLEQMKLAQKRLKRAGFIAEFNLDAKKFWVNCPNNMSTEEAKTCAKEILDDILNSGKEKVDFT